MKAPSPASTKARPVAASATGEAAPTAPTTAGPSGKDSKAPQMCDVCGLTVDPAEAIYSEVSVAGAMCPSPMAFHKPCFEAASVMWTPDPDSYCQIDNRFPESQKWDHLQAEAEAAADSTSPD